LKVKGTCQLHLQFERISLARSEDGGDMFLQNVDWLSMDIPEDTTLHNHHCENVNPT
jgi:hypothetical protein